MIRHNKVCELEDFSDPELAAIIRDAFKHIEGVSLPNYASRYARRKHWEIAMSIRALRQFGVLRRDASLLGVGAGMEVTNFYLTNHVRQVFATDLYLNPGVWDDYAPPMMMSEPDLLAPYAFDQRRLVVQHMDGRLLQYPNNTFDGIYSSGSIEHFGSLDFIANAAYEMGRVLKPGGILTLATEYKISGPVDGDGFVPSTYLLSAERIRRYIVEASGLEPVDDLDTSVSEATLQTERNLVELIRTSPEKDLSTLDPAFYPNVVLESEGYRFGSVHLTLRKPDNYPVVDNRWAKPSAETVRAAETISQETSTALLRLVNPAPSINFSPSPAIQSVTQATQQSAALVGQWDAYYERTNHSAFAQRLPKPLGTIYRTLLRVRHLGKAWDAQHGLYNGVTNHQAATLTSLSETSEELHKLQVNQTQFEQRLDRLEHRVILANARAIRSNEGENSA